MENRKHYLFELKPFSDEDGFLAVIEEEKQIPFKIKRIFYEYGVKSSSLRGEHANKNSQFCLIAVSGSCNVIVQDGSNKINYYLDEPFKVLYLDKMIWKTMTNFSKDCVLLVLSDCLYDKDEYIREFNEYLESLKAL